MKKAAIAALCLLPCISRAQPSDPLAQQFKAEVSPLIRLNTLEAEAVFCRLRTNKWFGAAQIELIGEIQTIDERIWGKETGAETLLGAYHMNNLLAWMNKIAASAHPNQTQCVALKGARNMRLLDGAAGEFGEGPLAR